MWASVSESIFNRLLVDSNGDGLIDGVIACFVPLAPSACEPPLWAAMANFASRLGLESPAIHLPMVCSGSEIQAWQCPLFISFADNEILMHQLQWSEPSDEMPLVDKETLRVAWVAKGDQRGLWIHGTEQAEVVQWFEQIATAVPEMAITEKSALDTPLQDLDLAALYTGKPRGLFTALHDGFLPDDCQFRLVLGPEVDVALGKVAVNLAARLGLETAGLTLPLAMTSVEPPDDRVDNHLLLMGFPHEQPEKLQSKPGRRHRLGLSMARYLAEAYPFLNVISQQTGNEQQTLQEIVARLRELAHLHSPVAKLALAEVQADRPLHLLASGSPTPTNLRRVVFRQEWNPADGFNDRERTEHILQETVVPALEQSELNALPAQITIFCNVPAPARQRLATAVRAMFAMTNKALQIQVLPAHKAGLAWLLEEQLPHLQAQDIAQVRLYFQEFQPPCSDETWLDLPTRWLQELFPADELLAQRLELAHDHVQIEMLPVSSDGAENQDELPIYRIEAHAPDGTLVHTAELHLLWNERLYMSGLPQFGTVHPATGGIIVRWSDGTMKRWVIPADLDLFWDFYQDSVLPALRQHVLVSGEGRPTVEREPYFDQLAVDVTMGAPDEPLGIYEEFISLGEALHEDIYFNTLDYLAALGEAFAGRSIEAAGQVVPWVHDYYDAKGNPLPLSGPRATITLYDWAVPCHLPDLGLTVGDHRDMPIPVDMQIQEITVDATGTAVSHVAITLHYADAKQAHFAARVFTRWHTLVGQQTGFPLGIAVTVQCCASSETMAEVVFPAADVADSSPTNDSLEAQSDSAIVGPQQLLAELNHLSHLPGIRTWQVGRSYQGRPGHVIDVTLPLEAHQTHVARRKLSLQKPTLLFVARHHANEVSSTTTALQMARAAAVDPTQRQWLERVNLVFLPMENPDGAALHYVLMAEHPRWKHHAARFNAAGKEFSWDIFDPTTPFGEARFRRETWLRWLPDAIVDNHGVPSHEWCQPFAGYTTPPRFRVSYHVVQAMLYGIITFADDPTMPHLHQAAAALRSAVAQEVAATPWLYQRNQYWLDRYYHFGHRWLPAISPMAVHEGMLFFYRGVAPEQLPPARRNFAMRYPQITLLDWVTEVPDETAQGDYLAECAEAHRVANQAMIQLLVDSAQPMVRFVAQQEDERLYIGFRRRRQVG